MDSQNAIKQDCIPITIIIIILPNRKCFNKPLCCVITISGPINLKKILMRCMPVRCYLNPSNGKQCGTNVIITSGPINLNSSHDMYVMQTQIAIIIVQGPMYGRRSKCPCCRGNALYCAFCT